MHKLLLVPSVSVGAFVFGMEQAEGAFAEIHFGGMKT